MNCIEPASALPAGNGSSQVERASERAQLLTCELKVGELASAAAAPQVSSRSEFTLEFAAKHAIASRRARLSSHDPTQATQARDSTAKSHNKCHWDFARASNESRAESTAKTQRLSVSSSPPLLANCTPNHVVRAQIHKQPRQQVQSAGTCDWQLATPQICPLDKPKVQWANQFRCHSLRVSATPPDLLAHVT